MTGSAGMPGKEPLQRRPHTKGEPKTPEHWRDDEQLTWEVKVGERVRQCPIPDPPPGGWGGGVPTVGTLGTVVWVDQATDGPPEVWVRWDGAAYNDPEDSNMADWIEPADDG